MCRGKLVRLGKDGPVKAESGTDAHGRGTHLASASQLQQSSSLPAGNLRATPDRENRLEPGRCVWQNREGACSEERRPNTNPPTSTLQDHLSHPFGPSRSDGRTQCTIRRFRGTDYFLPSQWRWGIGVNNCGYFWSAWTPVRKGAPVQKCLVGRLRFPVYWDTLGLPRWSDKSCIQSNGIDPES